MQDISKSYEFTLDTKLNKLLKCNLVFNSGDDITLNINITEDGKPKDLTNCKVDLIAENGNLPIIHGFEQGGISIVDSKVIINCKNNYIDRVGTNIGQIFISDEDQSISTQKFLFITNSTLVSEDIKDSENKIDTLRKLDTAIDNVSGKLDLLENKNTEINKTIETSINNINGTVINLTKKVNDKISEANSTIDNHTNAVEKKVSDFEISINNRIQGVEDTVNYELIKITELTPIKVSGSTTIGFSSNEINIPAVDLVRSAFDFCVSGSPSSTQIIQSATGHIVFYVEVINGIQVVKGRLNSIIDVAIQGRQLNCSFSFVRDGVITDTLNVDDVGYKLLVKANIHKANINTGECRLTPLGRSITL